MILTKQPDQDKLRSLVPAPVWYHVGSILALKFNICLYSLWDVFWNGICLFEWHFLSKKTTTTHPCIILETFGVPCRAPNASATQSSCCFIFWFNFDLGNKFGTAFLTFMPELAHPAEHDSLVSQGCGSNVPCPQWLSASLFAQNSRLVPNLAKARLKPIVQQFQWF